MDHDNEKNIISIANVNVDDLFETFSFEFIFNGTHIMCQNNEKWPQQWTILPDKYSANICGEGCARKLDSQTVLVMLRTDVCCQLTFSW